MRPPGPQASPRKRRETWQEAMTSEAYTRMATADTILPDVAYDEELPHQPQPVLMTRLEGRIRDPRQRVCVGSNCKKIDPLDMLSGKGQVHWCC